MKKVLIFLSLIFLILGIYSCKKTGEANPLTDVNNLGIGSYLTLASEGNLNFNFNTPASKVEIKVGKYGEDVEKVILYVVEGANSDPASWKKIKTVSFTGSETILSATSLEVATALGVPVSSLSPGNFYTFYNQIVTKTGKIYDLSNVGNALGSNSNYNAVFYWTAYITCPFVAPVGGSYKVVYDGDWQDWNTGDVVQVLDGPVGSNTISLEKVWPGGGIIINPLIVNIDPATGTAKVPLVTFGKYSAAGTQYTAQGAGKNDVAGYVFSCTGYITLNIIIKSSGGTNFGANKLKLRKI